MSIRHTIVTSLAVAAAGDAGLIRLVVCPLGQRRRRPRSLFEIPRRAYSAEAASAAKAGRRTSLEGPSLPPWSTCLAAGQVRYPGDHPKSYCTLYWTLSRESPFDRAWCDA